MLCCMTYVLYHTGGAMFNSIRNTPYVGQDGQGRISYIAGGFQNQFGLESQMISGLCKSPLFVCLEPLTNPPAADGALALTAIYLGDRIPRYADPKIQSIAVIGTAAFMLLLYSFLLSIFRVKNGGYPFSLPPFL